MNPQESSSLLNQLKDIHSPDAISQWPWAIGWWILLALFLIVLFISSLLLFKKYHQNKWKRQAIAEFHSLRRHYAQSPNVENLTNINRLLKQAYASAVNDRTPLHFSGKEWANCLSSVKKKNQSILSDKEVVLLTEAIYSNEPIRLSDESLNSLDSWIRALK